MCHIFLKKKDLRCSLLCSCFVLIFDYVSFPFSKVVTDLHICNTNNLTFLPNCETSCFFKVQYSIVNGSTLCPLKAHLINPEVILYKVITFIIMSEPCLLV